MRKKLVALISAFMMTFSLAACGSSGNTAETNKKGTTSNEAKGDFSAAMVADTGGINDQSFNQSAWEGLQAFSKETGANVSYLESSQASDYASNFDKLTDEEHNLIWGIGFNTAEPILAAAKMNPDKLFAIADNEFPEGTAENLASTIFDVQDSSFLVGYIAGLTTQKNRVGYIGGMKSPTMDKFEYGYMAGVEYAAKELGKEIKVDVQFTESFTDAAKGKAMAANMYNSGSDILFHAAGGAGVGVIEQAIEENKLVIGVDRDQSYLAPKNILTSALKNVGVATKELSKEVMDGNNIGGKIFTYGLAEGAVGIPKENPNMKPEVYEKAMKVQELISKGEIVPPYSEDTYKSFSK